MFEFSSVGMLMHVSLGVEGNPADPDFGRKVRYAAEQVQEKRRTKRRTGVALVACLRYKDSIINGPLSIAVIVTNKKQALQIYEKYSKDKTLVLEYRVINVRNAMLLIPDQEQKRQYVRALKKSVRCVSSMRRG